MRELQVASAVSKVLQRVFFTCRSVFRSSLKICSTDTEESTGRCLSSSTAALLDFISQRSAKSLGNNFLELPTATAQCSGLRRSSWQSFATDAAAGQKAEIKPSSAAGKEESVAGAAGKSDRVLIPRVHRPPPSAKTAPATGRAGGLR